MAALKIDASPAPQALSRPAQQGSVSCVSCFALTAQREYEYRVERFDMAIEGDIAAAVATDDEFAIVTARRTPDQRIALEDGYRVDELANAAGNVFDFMLLQVRDDPRHVFGNLGRKLDARHA